MFGALIAIGSLIAGSAGAATAAAWLAAGSMVVGVYQAKEQRRKALRAAERKVQDRTVMVREATADRPHLFGRCRVSGQVQFPGSSGQYNDFLTYVLAIGDRIDAIEDVWFNGESIGALDSEGRTTTGPFYSSRQALVEVTQVIPASRVVTIPHTVTSHSVSFWPVVSHPTANTGGNPQVPGDLPPPLNWWDIDQIGVAYHEGDPDAEARAFSVSESGEQTLFTFNAAAVGLTITINYAYTVDAAWARAKAFLGAPGQTADLHTIAMLPGVWTANDRFTGTSGVAGWFRYEPDIYPSGIPDVSAVVRGELCYDPRTESSAWTRNPALIARHYIAKLYPSAAFNDASFIAAANACEEQVNTSSGDTQDRYTFDGAISSDTAPKAGLEDILQAMVGSAVESGGEWHIWAGVYSTPTIELDQDDLSDGEISIQSTGEAGDAFNGVSGKYLDPVKWVEDSFPAYISPTYVAQDGGDEEVLDLDLTQITDIYRAQRVAKLLLFKSRQALTFACTCRMSAYEVTPGDMVKWTLPRYGWSEKVFRCIDRVYDPAGFLVFLFQEDASAIYAWDYSEQVNPDPSPNTTLPDARTVASPTMTFDSGQEFVTRMPDGTTRPFLRAYWTAMDVTVERVEIQWRRAYETQWRSVIVAADRLMHDVYDIAAQDLLLVQARAINGAQVRSPWAMHSVSVDVTAPPNTTATSRIEAGVNLLKSANFDFNEAMGSPWPWSSDIGERQEFSVSPTRDSSYGWCSDGTYWSDYRPHPMNALMIERLSGAAESVGIPIWPALGLPVAEGMRVEIGARVAQLNTRVSLGLLLLDASRQRIPNAAGGHIHSIAQNAITSVQETETQYTGVAGIGSYKPIFAFYTVVAGVTEVQPVWVMQRRASSGRSYGVMTMPYLGYAYRGQVDPSPWGPGF